MRREPSMSSAFLVAAWAVVDAWLIYGAMQHVFWRLG